MLYARWHSADDRRQTLREHIENTARLASQAAAGVGLRALLRLCGYLHDAGKAARAFQAYLFDLAGLRGSVEHAGYGAVYAFNRWHTGGRFEMLTAEMIAFAVAAHHGRLPDLLSPEGDSFAQERLQTLRFADQDAVMATYFEQVMPANALDALFAQAVAEVRALDARITAALSGLPSQSVSMARQSLFGMAQRSVFSLLIDADRWDAYCFETQSDPFARRDAPFSLWRERLEKRLRTFPCEREIDRLRAALSLECLHSARGGAGLYRLCVPTGGGKTYASLRYALASALENGFTRIVYTAPFKTILEQTASDLRGVFTSEADAPGADEWILEHHSDAAPGEDAQGAADGEALQRYQLLSQRWDAPLVLTTMVQLLNTLFSGQSACARRMSALQNCVLIIDEAQSIPVRCMHLFTLALRYLSACCGCAVVLCTATQPLLDQLPRFPLPAPRPMIRDEAALHRGFRRVALIDRTARETAPGELAEEVLNALDQAGSALCIFNTKKTAFAAYAAFCERLPADAPLYCLTTSQCPAHRHALLSEVRARLKARQRVICVATQLIEAGVDVSFGLTVRALAGLDSVAQAAGRCNRNAERALGEVWLIRAAGENLTHLADIQLGREGALAALRQFGLNPAAYDNDRLSPRLVETYFRYIMQENSKRMDYPAAGTTLVGLLSDNAFCRAAYQDTRGRVYGATFLTQAFRTAGRAFCALDAPPFSLLVPYEKGAEYIQRLHQTPDLREAARLLRLSQRYTVSVFPHAIERFTRLHCVQPLPGGCCYALDRAYYHEVLGVTDDRKEMDLLEY